LPIAKVLYLDILLDKLAGSWKKAVDSQDSFCLPDPAALMPNEFDPKLPAFRRVLEGWLPDRERKQLFKGWHVLSLNPSSVS
jgi:hypothetical protein